MKYILILILLAGCCKEACETEVVEVYYMVPSAHIDSSGIWNGNALRIAIELLEEYNINRILIPAGNYDYNESISVPPNINIKGIKYEKDSLNTIN